MNGEEQMKIYKEVDDKIIEVTSSKRHDYAAEEDVLGNFKGVSKAAESLGIDIGDPTQYALFMVILKMDKNEFWNI